MISGQKRTDVVSNNLANAVTTGFKCDITVHKEFHNMLIQRINDFDEGGTVGLSVAPFNSLADLGTSREDVTQIKGFNADPFYRPNIGQLGLGDYIDEVAVNYEQGALESTGNAYDLAIAGDGFFAIQTPQGVRYTRNGAFFKNNEGYLQDIRGYNLLDTQGNPIRIPSNIRDSQVFITGNGTISIPGDAVQLNEQNNRWESVGNQNNQQQILHSGYYSLTNYYFHYRIYQNLLNHIQTSLKVANNLPLLFFLLFPILHLYYYGLCQKYRHSIGILLLNIFLPHLLFP